MSSSDSSESPDSDRSGSDFKPVYRVSGAVAKQKVSILMSVVLYSRLARYLKLQGLTFEDKAPVDAMSELVEAIVEKGLNADASFRRIETREQQS